MHVFPGFLHDTFNERDNHLPIAMARQFIRDAFAYPARPPCLLSADRDGPTYREYQALAAPLPRWSPRRFGYAVTRALLATIGRLSDGVRLGWRRGFDSGAMLDYVYRDRAAGFTPLGRLIDRAYLDSPGWRGIRSRRRQLQSLLSRAIMTVGIEGRPVRIADIAAGPGRYVLEVLARRPERDIVAVLADRDAGNVEAGRRLARELDLDGVRCVQGDAFDAEQLCRLSPRPTIAIVSGLYELFPDNAPVEASLAGLTEALEDGGYLIYTNQPWHPQLDFIARVLTNHRDGGRWVMRRRSQAEMDQLVAAAGFDKVDMTVDEGGIFTVSLARKRPRPVVVLPTSLSAAAV
ncbi:MAG: hypothetical protein HKM95_15020, partial [Inquilinus sp.]|nr:hypothetical protein [Inquilinus sp.]